MKSLVLDAPVFAQNVLMNFSRMTAGLQSLELTSGMTVWIFLDRVTLRTLVVWVLSTLSDHCRLIAITCPSSQESFPLETEMVAIAKVFCPKNLSGLFCKVMEMSLRHLSLLQIPEQVSLEPETGQATVHFNSSPELSECLLDQLRLVPVTAVSDVGRLRCKNPNEDGPITPVALQDPFASRELAWRLKNTPTHRQGHGDMGHP